MDANGQSHWLLADAGHWLWRAHARWDAGCRALGLASERRLSPIEDALAARSTATSALERIPRTLDGVGCVAYWNPAQQAILARSDLPGEAIRLALDADPSDVCVGHDGILYAVVSGAIRLHDLRGRWDDVSVEAEGFTPWRVAADPQGGLWVLERGSGRLARLTGQPLPLGPYVDYAGTVFRPDPENCHPPLLEPLPAPTWPTDERPLALACDAQSGLLLLSWRDDAGESLLRHFDQETGLQSPLVLGDVRFAYALTWVGNGRVLVRVPGRADAPLFDLMATNADGLILPGGEVYPLAAEALEAPFVHRPNGPPHYPVTLDEGVRGSEPLHALSLPNLARHGEARHFDGDGHAQLIDSGNHQTVWHRLYAEARLLPQTGFIAWLAATAEPQPPAVDDADTWLPHSFGEVPDTRVSHAPRAAWEEATSEIPHHPGMAQWPQERDRAGLWSILIQNPRRRVRRLVGRFLWVRIELFGDGRVGPEVAALRAWGSRFSYRDRYLPRLYREAVHGAAAALPGETVTTLDVTHRPSLDAAGAPAGALADAFDRAGLDLGATAELVVQEAGNRWTLRDPGSRRGWQLHNQAEGVRVYRPQATQADFLERMLANFEGMLTPIEDRIAAAHLLTDPDSTPDENLEWIGAWVGVAFDPLLPAARRRAWLGAAPQLARLHGTRQGLELALDLASGGAVSGGEIVVIEDFRLRRLLATLLGVELEVEDDPLLPGLIVSGNSVVGDTLMLGEAETAELMALFRADSATEAENAAVLDFDARLAHRATILVHQAVDPQDLGLLRRVAELEAPAHVDLRVVSATWPFLVGIASLVGVDTYLGPRPPQRPARVSGSLAGRDYVIGPAVLDPRMAGATAMAPPVLPVADAGDDFGADFGASFTLDGSRSRAAPGRHLTTYRWRRLPSD